MTRQTFSQFVDRAFWTLLLALVGFGVKSMSSLNDRIYEILLRLESQEIQISNFKQIPEDLAELRSKVALIEYRLRKEGDK